MSENGTQGAPGIGGQDYEAGGAKLLQLFKLLDRVGQPVGDPVTAQRAEGEDGEPVGRSEAGELFELLCQLGRTVGRELTLGGFSMLMEVGLPFPIRTLEQRLTAGKGPQLVQEIGRQLGIGLLLGQSQAAAELEDEAAEAAGPAESALGELLAVLPGWIDEASRTPRESGSAQDRLLSKAKRYAVALREAREAGELDDDELPEGA